MVIQFLGHRDDGCLDWFDVTEPTCTTPTPEPFVWCDTSIVGQICGSGAECADPLGGEGNVDCEEGCACKCVWCVAYYTLDENNQWKQGQMTECLGGFTLVPEGFPGAPAGNCHKVFWSADNCENVNNEVRGILDAAFGGAQGIAWDDAGSIYTRCFQS